ncbi:lichenan operon transcriptional antiterminator [Microbacterium resistens]|uniref:Lichenan operon transcriptional antiterminator n=1 Tax=Microbacterium resistens TaxID=156977 RepID=A0ABU1S9J7_9MICO|nr:PTS sugar transporter subunit IIA [Microbacterium resistens]MDR6866279.1 lichenan operon transcriptional antiterminator [Microbacterium resistens]
MRMTRARRGGEASGESVSIRRQDQLLSTLLREGSWATAARLADILGVTPRSVRTYVAAANARVGRGDAIESGPAGYRAGPSARDALRARGSAQSTPRARLHRLVRALLADQAGVDVFATAERLHVSEATLEADLGRVRALLDGTGLSLERDREIVRLRGPEQAQRRLLSRLAHDEIETAGFPVDPFRLALEGSVVEPGAVAPFKADLVAELGRLGYYVNELAISDVLLHIAIAADRVAAGRAIDRAADPHDDEPVAVGEVIGRLSRDRLGVELGVGDRTHLARLVLTRVVAPGSADPAAVARAGLEPAVEEAVRAEVVQAAADYQVDLVDDAFILRLALHVQNLRRRAREETRTRNPLTRSLKSAYPMIFEVAVSIVSGLHDRLGLRVDDDEIAYVAMHIGGRLERSRRADSMLTATIVCPGYYELHEVLRSRVDRSLGPEIEVVRVVTQIDPDWAAIGTDLVLSTIDPPASADRVVRIQPFLTDADVERVQQSAARLRRSRRLTRLREELSRYFSAEAFVHPIPDEGEEAIIRRLGSLLVDGGIIGEDYVENTIQRERLSSTAFSDALAVPHALQMTAERTAIAVGVAAGSVAWGTGRVQVVALAAFSEKDRAAFQTVFEQLVEVFGEGESVQRIVRRGTTFAAFLDELVAVIDG